MTVLDSHGNIVSVDLYSSELDNVALTAKGLLVQRGTTLELRSGGAASAHQYTLPPTATLADADSRWAAWSDGKLVHVIRLPDGAAVATYPGTARGHRRLEPVRRERQGDHYPNAALGSRAHVPDRRRPPRRSRRPRARRPQGTDRERGRADAEPRPSRHRRLERPAVRRRARTRAVERGRALVDARLPARGVSRPRGLRGARPRPGASRPSTSSRTRRCVPPSGATTAGGSPAGPIRSATQPMRRRWSRPATGSRSTGSCSRSTTSAAARRCCASRATRTSASPTPTRSSATGIPCSGRSRSCRRRSDPRAPRRSGRAGRWSSSPSTTINKRRAEEGLPALNVITLKWWGRPRQVPTFERAARPARHVHRRVGVPARAREERRPRHDRGARDGQRRRPISRAGST